MLVYSLHRTSSIRWFDPSLNDPYSGKNYCWKAKDWPVDLNVSLWLIDYDGVTVKGSAKFPILSSVETREYEVSKYTRRSHNGTLRYPLSRRAWATNSKLQRWRYLLVRKFEGIWEGKGIRILSFLCIDLITIQRYA